MGLHTHIYNKSVARGGEYRTKEANLNLMTVVV